jgi:arylformamidase
LASLIEGVRDGIVTRRCDQPTVADPWPAHRICLANDVCVIEGLADLAELAGTRFTFLALPLPIVGGSGSPVRAVAWSAGW